MLKKIAQQKKATGSESELKETSCASQPTLYATLVFVTKDKNNAGDAVRIAENGYTMIENYALSLEFPDEYEKAWNEAYGE